MQVEYDGAERTDAVVAAVEAAGYGAAPAGGEELSLEDTDTPRLKRRLIASLCFLVPLMYVTMGHMVGLPLPFFLDGGGWEALGFALVQLALTLPVCWINRAFFISGYKGVRSLAPGNGHAGWPWGRGASLLYGLYAIVMMLGGIAAGDEARVLQFRHDLYFESAAMILTLITVGKTLEAYSKGKTTNALKSLMDLAPQTARILRDGEPVTVPIAEVQVGDVFLVRPGGEHPGGRRGAGGRVQRERGPP